MTREGILAIPVQRSLGLRLASRPMRVEAPNCCYGCTTVCQCRAVEPRTTRILFARPSARTTSQRHGNTHHYPDTVSAQRATFAWSRSVLLELLSTVASKVASPSDGAVRNLCRHGTPNHDHQEHVPLGQPALHNGHALCFPRHTMPVLWCIIPQA